jgi:hypothetical protein
LAEHNKRGYQALAVTALKKTVISTAFTIQKGKQPDIYLREMNGKPRKRAGPSITHFSLTYCDR